MGRRVEDRLLAGDAEAAREVEGWVRLAARPFVHRLGDRLDDVVQESILEVIEALRDGRYRDQGAFRGFVWRSTSSNCLDRLRRKRRWVEVEIDAEAMTSPEVTALVDLLRRESIGSLRELLAAQPKHCRELWREILAGSTYQEMSDRIGTSAGALRVRVLRCRRRALALWTGSAGNEESGETLRSMKESG